jgi:prophage antirepressor-like protein
MSLQLNECKTLNNNKLGIFEYVNDGILRVYGTPEEPWFSGKDIATILGYVNTAKAIRDHIDEEDRCLLENKGVNESVSINCQGHSVLINESGVFSLILRSRKPEAKSFKRWVTSEVLPSIRKTGSYNNVLVNQKQLKVQETKDIIELFDRIQTANLTDRDRLLFLDYSRNLFLDAPSNNLQLKNENTEWSISKRLTDEYGISNNKKVKNMTITFGKVLVKKYKELHNGDEPPKRDQFVDGTVRNINCYFEQDWIEFGDKLLEEYFAEYLKFEEND